MKAIIMYIDDCGKYMIQISERKTYILLKYDEDSQPFKYRWSVLQTMSWIMTVCDVTTERLEAGECFDKTLPSICFVNPNNQILL